MKRTISPCESVISLRTAFSRSSNSPRYFAPATSAPMSRPTMLLVLQPLGDVTPDDALSEPFDDRRLPDARLADEHRVVLGAAQEHLDHAPDFLVPADDRVELAFAREVGELAAVALERLVLRFRVLIRDALRAAYRRHRRQDGVLRDLELMERARGGGAAALARDREEQMLRADVLVLQPLGFLLRRIRDGAQARRQSRLRSAVGRRKLLDLRLERGRHRGRIDVHLPDDLRDDALFLADQREQHVLRLDLRVIALVGHPLRGGDRFLGFLGVLLEIHIRVSSWAGLKTRPSKSIRRMEGPVFRPAHRPLSSPAPRIGAAAHR